jgi:hypothetical protein
MVPLPAGAEQWTAAERELAIAVLSGESVVVNVRKAGPHKRLVPWLVDEGLLTYVGHAGPRHDWPESPFANPFVKLAGSDRATMVTRYREWLYDRPALRKRIPDLAGRAIGCWCAPNACHADVLLEEVRGAGRRPR